jgi:hypothetical protein
MTGPARELRTSIPLDPDRHAPFAVGVVDCPITLNSKLYMPVIIFKVVFSQMCYKLSLGIRLTRISHVTVVRDARSRRSRLPNPHDTTRASPGVSVRIACQRDASCTSHLAGNRHTVAGAEKNY